MKESIERNKEISAKIKGKLAERKIRQDAIAKCLSINIMTVSQKLNGNTAFTVGEFALLAMMANFSAVDVLDILTPKNF